MTWFQLNCINVDEADETTPALIWLEDVSAVGPEHKVATFFIGAGSTKKVELVRAVNMRSGHSFIVRTAEGDRLVSALVEGVAPEPTVPVEELIVVEEHACACRDDRGRYCGGEVKYRDSGKGPWSDLSLCEKHWAVVELSLSESEKR